jgi:hypothetical protein
MTKGGQEAVRADDEVVPASDVRRLKSGSASWSGCSAARPWKSRSSSSSGARTHKKTELAVELCAKGRFPMKAVTDTLGVARSNVVERVKGARPKRGPQTRVGDLELAAEIRRLVDARPTYGDRRIAALIKRERRSAGAPRSMPSVFTA